MSPPRAEPDGSTYSGRVARRIREVRESKGLTGADLVERMKPHGIMLTPAAYSHWETGRVKPQWDALPALAKALGVSIHDLIPAK